MTFEIIVDLLSNIVLLMSLSIVYSLFTNESSFSRFATKIIMGLSVSILGFIIMSSTVKVSEGIFFDGRSILMLLSAVYFGLIPTIMGSITLSLYRIIMGGAGVIPGILWVIIPSIIGLFWRYTRIKNENVDIRNISRTEQYIVLFITQLLMVGILFLFPNKVPSESINAVAIPLIIFYPAGGLLVSMFMIRQRMNYFNAVQVKTREEEYKNLFNKSKNYSFLIRPDDGMIMNVNQAAIDCYGYTFEEFTSMTYYDLNLMSKNEFLKKQLKSIKDNKDYFITKHVLKNKEIIDVEIRKAKIVIDGETYSYETVTDITKRVEDQRRFQDVNVRLESTLHSVNEGIISTNEYGQIEIINNVATSYLYTKNNLIGKSILDVISIYSKDNKQDFKSIYHSVLSTKQSFKSMEPYLFVNKNEHPLYIDFSLSPVYYNDTLKGTILVFRDVTNQFEQNKQIQYISQHDYLTGLYNRYFLEVEMKRLNTKRQLPISIIHGDINGLKLTNDAYGHAEGDRLINEIGSIFKKATRSEDIISRWGGDEFIILLPQTSNEDAKKVIKRIRDLQLKSMYEIMTPSISLGLATKEDESQELNAVLIEAETKMYNNKQIDGKVMRQDFLNTIKNKLYNIHPQLNVHSENVSNIAQRFGKYLKLKKEDIETLKNLGLYHDIGWINIPDHILLKKENLTADDKEVIYSHSETGFRIMKSIPELSHLAELILASHERYDGNGYPNKLRGSAIPYLSRVIAICDAFDMMTNNSVYSPIKPLKEAIEEIKTNMGTQFDPLLASKFITYIDTKKNDE